MELDDLRKGWKQPAADSPAALNATALDQLLRRGTQNFVAKLWRNAWAELVFTVAVLLLSGVALLYAEKMELRVMLIWLVVLCFISIVSYHRQLLTGIRGLGRVEATVREHVALHLDGLRKTMRRSYQSALLTLPVTFGIGFFFSLHRIVATYSGGALWRQLGLLAVGTGIAGVCAYFLVRWLGRRLLQDLYGRHLDRLEASLRELGDEPLA